MAQTPSTGYTLLNTFLAEMLQYCNGAPSIMLRIHLINSTIDLCNKALLLKKNASEIQFEEDVHTYILKYPQDRYRAIALDEIKIEGEEPLIITTEHEMDVSFGNWRDTESSQPTRVWLTSDLNKFRVWPTPEADIDTDVIIRSIVTYKRGQIEVDDFIYEKWYDIIQAGALAKILAIPSATWFNAEVSARMARVFSRGVGEARKTTLTGTGKQSGRVTPQSYLVVGSNDAKRGSTSWV